MLRCVQDDTESPSLTMGLPMLVWKRNATGNTCLLPENHHVISTLERGYIMTLREYVDQRLNEHEGTNALIEGLQNGVKCDLTDALKHIPEQDWNAQISRREKEHEGETLIWLQGCPEPSYVIQD